MSNENNKQPKLLVITVTYVMFFLFSIWLFSHFGEEERLKSEAYEQTQKSFKSAQFRQYNN